jgi:polysaccharide biosynthesis/export protein
MVFFVAQAVHAEEAVQGEAIEASPAQALVAKSSGMADYLIGPLDLLEVKVLYTDDISRTVRVDSQGNISLPLIGSLKAANLTTEQLENVIAEKLSQDLMQNPQVSVFIKEFISLRMTVQGAVTKAGLYDFQGRATLLQAISMAGGLTEKANENKVKVIRRLSTQGADTLEFDLALIRMNKINDPVLQNGDIVVVEQNTPIGIQGMVRKSGNYYPNGGKMTLSQIISQAEGLTDFADPTDIHVLSTTETGRQVSVVYNFEKIREGKLPDPELHPGDLVVVETSGVKSLIYGISNIFRGFVRPIGQ